jgi:hypothetical protein
LRGSLLTGASALALSVSASGAHAQVAGAAKDTPPTFTFWAEGALFWTGGGSFNVPALPGLTSPYLSFNPKSGYEGAVGLDYRWPNQSWHFVFDGRYGQSRSASRSSSSFHSSIFHPFGTPSFGFLQTSAGTSQATEREGHLVADFMIGRDFGLGSGTGQFQFGIRVADLWAKANVQEAGQRTFYSSFHSPSIITVAQTATGEWTSRMFGTGPRLAFTGAIPIAGLWTFDYGAGIAELLGTRSFEASVTSTGGAPTLLTTFDTTAWIFNADGSAALSYWFTRNYKLSAGVRADFYNDALTTYNVNTGGFENVNRLFWGPFIRLTGAI